MQHLFVRAEMLHLADIFLNGAAIFICKPGARPTLAH
jgi:hypothetical protein